MISKYSNEDFDVAQNIAIQLNDADRKAGTDRGRSGVKYNAARAKAICDLAKDADEARAIAKVICGY